MMASSRERPDPWTKYNRQLLDIKEDGHFKTNYGFCFEMSINVW